MFLEIPDLLAPAELARLRELAGRAAFVDGRVSNPHSPVKNNLHHDRGDAAFGAASQLLAEALHRSEPFRLFAFPRRFAAPTLTKHRPGMHYGLHADAAQVMSGQKPIRTDLSCTVFLSDPESYEGGELAVHLGTRAVTFKGQAGSALIYPSTTLHEVRPVASGERLVGITFIESLIPDPSAREMIYELGEVSALEGLGMSVEGRARLDAVVNNLKRAWMEVV